MRFNKPALTIDEQATLLIERGLGGSHAEIASALQRVNYYRLAAYWHPWRTTDADQFREGAHIQVVCERYLFDKRLRLLMLDALEGVEVAVRTRIAYELATRYGPFGYCTTPVLFGANPTRRANFLEQLKDDFRLSDEVFAQHFRQKYGDSHSAAPVWMAVEVVSFGRVVTMFQGCPDDVRNDISKFFNVPTPVFESWLRSLNVIRNICAHHGRLWNRTLGFKPMIPRKYRYPEWHEPVQILPDRVFGPLTILAWLQPRVSFETRWATTLSELLASHPSIPVQQMGFPETWKNSPIWKPLLQAGSE